MKRVFFLDIDGTTLDTYKKVSAFNIRALKQAKDSGCRIFINTGRGLRCVPKEITQLPLDGIVSGCGCTISIAEKIVYSDCPDTAAVFQYISGIFQRKEKCFLEGENCLFRINCFPEDIHTDPSLRVYCKLARLDFSLWTPLFSAQELLSYPDARIPKLNLIGAYAPDELKRYQTHYDGVVDGVKCEMYTRGNSKATGMHYVMEHYFPGYESVAIGDSVNDIDMMREADISVAMGNASEEIKRLCTLTTDTCDNDGMGKAIIELCKEI